MCQENQVQLQDNVYVLRSRDETHVFCLKENDTVVEVMPKFSRRSNEWHLKDGRYVVVDISRSNNKAKPYEVIVWCYEVQNGMAERREIATFYENSIEDALMFVQAKLVYQC